jgi:hypothetical protein
MHQHAGGIHDPIVFDSKGNIVEIGRMNPSGSHVESRMRTTIGDGGAIVAADTTKGPPEDSLGVRFVRSPLDPKCMNDCSMGTYLYQPFAPLQLLAFAPDGEMATAVSSRYAISWTALGGRRLRLLERDVQGAVPTAKERDDAEKAFVNNLEFSKVSRASAPFGMPARKPPLDAMKFSSDGELWVKRTTPAGVPQEADVYDRTGKFVAIAEWPDKLSLMTYRTAIAGRAVLAVAMDSLDTERVVRVRFR